MVETKKVENCVLLNDQVHHSKINHASVDENRFHNKPVLDEANIILDAFLLT